VSGTAGRPVRDDPDTGSAGRSALRHAGGAADSAPRLGTGWLVLGSLLSGLAAYAFQVLGSRVLGEEAFAPISVLWTIQYLIVSIGLFSVETYVTRTVALEQEAGRRRLEAQGVALVAWITGLAGFLAAVTWWLRAALFAGAGDLALVVAAITLAYGVFVMARGDLAGRRRFRAYGLVTAAESVLRFALAVPVLLLWSSTRALAWVMPVGAAVAALWWPVARRRPDPPAPPVRNPSDLDLLPGAGPASPTATGFLVPTTIANAASQTLLASGPLVLVALGAGPGEVSVFFVTVTAARVPIVLAYGGLLSRLLPPLTDMAGEGLPAASPSSGLRRRPLGRVADLATAGTLVVATLGAAAAWFVGRPLVGLLFGEAFAPSRPFVTATAAGVLLATGALLLNQILIARSAERRLVLPWLCALAVAAATIVLVPADPTTRASAGFVAGELAALAGLLVADRRAGAAAT